MVVSPLVPISVVWFQILHVQVLEDISLREYRKGRSLKYFHTILQFEGGGGGGKMFFPQKKKRGGGGGGWGAKFHLTPKTAIGGSLVCTQKGMEIPPSLEREFSPNKRNMYMM